MKIILLVFFFVCLSSFIPCRRAYALESPKEEEALFIAQKAIDDGFYDVALTLFERFLKNYPGSKKTPEINLYIGQCYYYQNRFIDALKRFEGLFNEPGARDIKDAVVYWIAEVHFKGNNFSKAAEYYRMIIDKYPKSAYLVSSYYSLGWCLFQEQQFKEALEYFIFVEEKYPNQPQVQDASFKIVECLYNLKDYTGLKERLKNYLKIYAKDITRLSYLYFYMAEAEYYLNNLTEAVEGYEKVIAKSQDNKIKALSRLGMGWAYLKMKQYEQAKASLADVKFEDLEKKSQDVLLLAKAILNFDTKHFNEAKILYNQLLSSTLDKAIILQAFLGKADTLYNLGEYADALIAYRQALSRLQATGPASGETSDKLHYGLAWTLFKQGEYKEAIKEFQKIVKESEDKVVKISALCQIGDAYQDSGEYKLAQETYDAILKDYPDSLYSDYVQYQLGLTLLKDTNYNGAIMSFLSFRKNFPESKLLDDAVYALGLAYFQKQDYNASKEVFEEFIRAFKDSPLVSQATYILGTSFYNLGKFNEAIEVFKNIIRTFNQDTELCQKAEYEVADCYYQLGDEKEAMNRFRLLRTKYPDSRLSAEIMWWLGEYYYRHNDLSLASRYFASLIQDFPKSNLVTDAYYILGSIYSQDDKEGEAIQNFKKVIELGKSDLAGQAAIAIAELYVKQGMFSDALGLYEKTLGEHQNLVSMIYPKIADLYYKERKIDEALEYYRKSLHVVPVREIADMQFKIAELLESQGKTDDAIEEYLKVTYLYPEDTALAVKSLLRVAKIYDEKEKYSQAVNIYKKVIAMNVPESKFAEEQVALIKSQE